MSLLPTYKRCTKCKKEFSFNPSTGKINCPYCGSFGGETISDGKLRVRAPREGISLGEEPVQDDNPLHKVMRKFVKK